MDWFLYDNGLLHERVNLITVSSNKTLQDSKWEEMLANYLLASAAST